MKGHGPKSGQGEAPAGELRTTTVPTGVRIEVYAKPRAKKSAILGAREGALEVALAAMPVEGAANEELVATLAKALGLRKADVELVRGQGSRTKLVILHGIAEADLRARLDLLSR